MNKKNEKITLEKLATKIKGLISRSALAKIEIGELLIKHKEDIEYGDTKAFYKSIGMKDRTAQYYMKIASNLMIQKLKADDKLAGLNMINILNLAGIETNNSLKKNKKPSVKNDEYKAVSIEKFSYNYKTCPSTKILKVQYEILDNRVHELEAELDELKGINKTA